MNRRIPMGMYGDVRGRGLGAPPILLIGLPLKKVASLESFSTINEIFVPSYHLIQLLSSPSQQMQNVF